ncbi:hypothetical protein Glove_707g116 [Diversispora epigaea]|uniref:F-box domain-containing protein n=1 Tax=Diversispora epigaea TaxID=1348612 RepID=A0A397G4U3_9GLOM|nr:hypothetical protein Glove_707g116 [Diversispora epigaea]
MYSVLPAGHNPKTPEIDADFEKELEEEESRKSQGMKDWQKKHGMQKAKGVKKCVRMVSSGISPKEVEKRAMMLKLKPQYHFIVIYNSRKSKTMDTNLLDLPSELIPSIIKNLPIQDLKNYCVLDDIWKDEVIREIHKRLIVDCKFVDNTSGNFNRRNIP